MLNSLLSNRRKASFRYPVGAAPRTAVLAPWFREPRSAEVRIFASGWCPQASAFAPAAVVGTREQLLSLAGSIPPSLTHALIAVERAGEPMLTGAERERLWRAFHVPIFEQVIGESGDLLAAECEAHDGLHIEVAGLSWAGYTIETALCACGRKTPRLAPASPAERVRAAAVYAR